MRLVALGVGIAASGPRRVSGAMCAQRIVSSILEWAMRSMIAFGSNAPHHQVRGEGVAEAVTVDGRAAGVAADEVEP